MDNFKEYLRHHRDELGDDEPRPRVWEQIERQLPSRTGARVVMLAVRWVAAACVIALAGIGAWYLLVPASHPVQHTLAVVSPVHVPVTEPVTRQGEEPISSVPEHHLPKKEADAKPESGRRPSELAENNEEEPATDELLGMENSFTQVINLQRSKINATPLYGETPGYFSDFKIQLNQMSQDEKMLRREIHDRGLTQDRISQLINIYQQKLNLLKSLQVEMNKTNNMVRQHQEPTDHIKTYFLNI